MIDELLKQIGKPYEMFFSDGNYQGCFYPVYFLYPHLPHYPLPSDDNSKNYRYGINLITKHFDRIKKEELQKGDLIATMYNNELHVAIYLEHQKVIHVFRGHELQLGRLKMFNDYLCFRVKK